MKYVLVFLFFYSVGIQAHNSSFFKNDSTTFVNKATVGIPKLLYAFMEDCKSTSENFGEGKIDENEEKGMTLFKLKFLDNYKNFDNSTELFDGIDSFLVKKENGWSSQGYTIFQALRDNYTSEINSANYNLSAVLDIGDITKIYIKKLDLHKNDKIHWDEVSNIFFLKETKSAYEEEKENQINSNGTAQNSNSNLRVRVVTPSENNYINIYNYLGYFGVFVFGFLCAIMFFNYKIRKLIGEKYYDYKRLYRNNYRGFSLIRFDVIKILKERKENYQKEAESKPIPKPKSNTGNSIPEWKQKELANSQPRSKSSQNVEEPIQEVKAQIIDSDVSSNQESYRTVANEKRITVFYFSAPEQNGSFLLENASSTATSRSYYKIEYVDDDNMGKLIYRSGNLDMSALSQMDFILSPVCDIENSSIINPTVIYVESPGSVIKEGDSWRIDQKIKLKIS
ncbi:hypothetical protein A9Q87_13425 [Flavobacteriales bacterium 34_180_T64]|nr:hypothetical protein A9Q87_13425 [Flavobacteriales bacterium 34_180_T64]